MAQLYDTIGRGYTRTRTADPSLAAQIRGALGDAATVVNVGAGTGNYEPPDCRVIAVEPSALMARSRPAGAAPVVRGVAESLPFRDGAFDAAMTVLSDHHWRDRERGFAEMRRVARRRVVVFTFEHDDAEQSWLVRDYLPQFINLESDRLGAAGGVAAALGGARVEKVPIPHDCRDGFFHAFWRRPERYLDPDVRAGISVFGRLDREHVQDGMRRLEADLRSGAWHARNAGILGLDALDLGYRLVIAER